MMFAPVALSDVLVNTVLKERKPCPFQQGQSNPPPSHLFRAKRGGRDAILSALTMEAKELTGAHAAGVSLFTSRDCEELRWEATQGSLIEYSGRRFPVRHSMCGVCLEHREAQLFFQPQRYFKWMLQNGVQLAEVLIVPLASSRNAVYGTLWVAGKDLTVNFDQADADKLLALAMHAIASLRSLLEPNIEESWSATRLRHEARGLFCELRHVPRNIPVTITTPDSGTSFV
ncbi:MAG TPA: GAF domain-containing protein [Telluria sp.]|jgi:hypothetical protein